MSKQWQKYAFGGVIFAFIAATGLGVLFWENKPEEAKVAPSTALPNIRKSLKSISAPGKIVVVGEIAPVTVSTGGNLSRWLVKEGNNVKEGQLIGLLENYRVAWQQLQQAIDGETTTPAPSIPQLTSALTTAIAKGSSSQEELSKKLLLARHKEQENYPPLTIAEARRRLALAEIRAPLTGQVVRILLKGKEITPGEPIVEIGRIDRVYISATLRASDQDRVRVGQRAAIHSSYLVEDLQGKVEAIEGKTVEVSLENPLKAISLADPEVRVKISPVNSPDY